MDGPVIKMIEFTVFSAAVLFFFMIFKVNEAEGMDWLPYVIIPALAISWVIFLGIYISKAISLYPNMSRWTAAMIILIADMAWAFKRLRRLKKLPKLELPRNWRGITAADYRLAYSRKQYLGIFAEPNLTEAEKRWIEGKTLLAAALIAIPAIALAVSGKHFLVVLVSYLVCIGGYCLGDRLGKRSIQGSRDEKII